MKYNEEIEIAKRREYKVVKSNDIIRKARYDLSLFELKSLSYILSMIKPTDEPRQTYVFSVNEFCKVCGIDCTSGRNYELIKETLKKLRDKSFYLTLADETEVTVGWLEKVWINKRSGNIRVRLDEDIEKYVMNLFENFTQYELLSTLPFQSKYSFRMYELLKSYSSLKQHTFDLEDLKRVLMCEHYNVYKDFRVKVVEIALKEINQYTDLNVVYEPIKQGKKIVKLHFEINKKSSWLRFVDSL